MAFKTYSPWYAVERPFQTQFSISADKIYEWNIDGLSEQEIINKIGHMSMVGIAYVNNHNLDHPEIVDLLATGFVRYGVCKID